ncbi:MAG: hypothetical protein ACOYL8_00390 [Patescibacteria group bacterium]
MRTVTEEEALEIADVIHELVKKFYSKNGAKFLEEAKKFLNEEPCWAEEELLHPFFGAERICIIGGSGMGVHAIEFRENHHAGELIFSDELAELIKSTRAEFGRGFDFPFEMLERAPMPFPFVIQSLGEDFSQEDFRSILRDENESLRGHYRNYQKAFQKMHENLFRSKAHCLKTSNVRVFRGPWLARGNIAQI